MNDTSLNRPTVLILGANGRLGCAAAHAFSNDGWQVLAQIRREPSTLLPAAAKLIRMNLSDPEGLVRAASSARVVVHAVNPVYTKWLAEALPALSCGLEVAAKLNAHFMLPGNVYNFGESMPPLLREDTLQRPSTRKGEIRVEMEEQIARWAQSGGLPASVIRAGDFFGMGRGSWLDLVIVKNLRTGKLVYPGPMNIPHPWAYLPDLARAFSHIAAQPSSPGLATWHFEGFTLTGDELLAAIETAASKLHLQVSKPYHHTRLPWGLIKAAGLVVPMWRELSEMAYLWQVPHALDGTRLATLSNRPDYKTPLATALSESLQALANDFPITPHPNN